MTRHTAIPYLQPHVGGSPPLLSAMRQHTDPKVAAAAIRAANALRGAEIGRGLVFASDSWAIDDVCIAVAVAVVGREGWPRSVARMDCQFSVPGRHTLHRHVQRWEGALRPAFVASQALCVLSLDAIREDPDTTRRDAVVAVLEERKAAGALTFVTTSAGASLPALDDLREVQL